MIRFDDKVALVTGSGRGLGAAYARLLAQRGAKVVVHDAGVKPDGGGFDPDVADTVVRQIINQGGIAVASYENLESRAGCQKIVDTTVETFGSVDILVHNAGLLDFVPIEETDSTYFERIVKVSLSAPFWLSQIVFPLMKQNNYGRIIFTTSGRAMYLEAALPGLTSYAVGKMGQLGLMNALAAESVGYNIRVNAISPVAATRMFRGSVSSGKLQPEQVAPGLAFLASSACDFSGVILRAGNGQFSTARWVFSEGVTLAGDELSPEGLEANWSQIIGPALKNID